jgi:hypothetical protein
MSVSATVLLDNRLTHFTNLDTLSGRVVLRLPTEAAIAGIQVKLEGESRTRLSGPRNPQNVHSEKKRTELEVHKVCYGNHKVYWLQMAYNCRFYIRLLPSSRHQLSFKPGLRQHLTHSQPAPTNIPSSSRSTYPTYSLVARSNARLVSLQQCLQYP